MKLHSQQHGDHHYCIAANEWRGMRTISTSCSPENVLQLCTQTVTQLVAAPPTSNVVLTYVAPQPAARRPPLLQSSNRWRGMQTISTSCSRCCAAAVHPNRYPAGCSASHVKRGDMKLHSQQHGACHYCRAHTIARRQLVAQHMICTHCSTGQSCARNLAAVCTTIGTNLAASAPSPNW